MITDPQDTPIMDSGLPSITTLRHKLQTGEITPVGLIDHLTSQIEARNPEIGSLLGFDVETAQREQRRARREVEKLLREGREKLEAEADRLLDVAPRLGRSLPPDEPFRA